MGRKKLREVAAKFVLEDVLGAAGDAPGWEDWFHFKERSSGGNDDGWKWRLCSSREDLVGLARGFSTQAEVYKQKSFKDGNIFQLSFKDQFRN